MAFGGGKGGWWGRRGMAPKLTAWFVRGNEP